MELRQSRGPVLLLCSCQLLPNSSADPGLPDLFLFFQMKPEIQISLWISQHVNVTTNSNETNKTLQGTSRTHPWVTFGLWTFSVQSSMIRVQATLIQLIP